MQRQVEGTVQNIIRPFLKKSSTFAVHANLNTKQLSRQLVWEPDLAQLRERAGSPDYSPFLFKTRDNSRDFHHQRLHGCS